MAFLLSTSAFPLGVPSSVVSAEDPTERSGSIFRLSPLFLCASCVAHSFFSRDKSDSARFNSSRSSRTRRSCAAIAVMKSFESVGEVRPRVSSGVGGNEDAVEEAGVGREGNAVGAAIGRVNDRRLEMREAVEAERSDRVSVKLKSSKCGANGPDISSGFILGSELSRFRA